LQTPSAPDARLCLTTSGRARRLAVLAVSASESPSGPLLTVEDVARLVCGRLPRWTGWRTPPLRHLAEDELFFLYEGSIEFNAAEKTHVVSAGEAIFVPKGTTHRYRNVGEGNALTYTIYTPAGMEGWFRKVFERVRRASSTWLPRLPTRR
jgi:mannose-6-phosphate isomerase-like protein (cupin superfamily)